MKNKHLQVFPDWLHRHASSVAVLIVAFLVWVLSGWATSCNFIRNNPFGICLAVLAGSALLILVGRFRRGWGSEQLISVVLLTTLIFRAIYTIAMAYDSVAHDVMTFTGDATKVSGGHFGLIEYLMYNGKLPDFNPTEYWCFYNPPGFHILSAIVLKCTLALGISPPYCYEALQCIPFFFSALTVTMSKRILEQFGLKGNWLLLAVMFVSCHPYFYISSATLTNDAMATFFTFLCIRLTVKWFHNQQIRTILQLGISLGIAMFTKLNAGMIAAGIAFIFVYAFFTNLGQWKKYIRQFGAFLAVSVPVAMFYPFRNLIKYGLPLFYVQSLGVPNPQYIFGTDVLSRLLIPSQAQELLHPFQMLDPLTEVNVWTETIRSSLFDEFMLTEQNAMGLVALLTFWLAIVIALFQFVVWLKALRSKELLPVPECGFIGVSYGAMLFSFVLFTFSQPFICSMNFRYIAPAMLFPLICSGLWLQRANELNTLKATRKIAMMLLVLFAILSLSVVLWLCVCCQNGNVEAVMGMLPPEMR